jgi:hypothetical protein
MPVTRFSVPIAALAMALSPPATAVTVSDASWLVGRWVGEGLGGHAEEIWSPGKNGRMVGHFQFTDGSQPDFYELMLIDEQAGGLRLRVKHFNADFTAWEDKGEWHSFDPVSVSPNLLKFDGLTIARDGDGMTSTVTVKGSDGVVRDISFRFRRAAD